MKKTKRILDKREVILHWFKNKKRKIKIDEDFFQLQALDSLEIIDLIDFMEKKFKIKFNNKDFQKHEFKSILGLSKIILEKKNEI